MAADAGSGAPVIIEPVEFRTPQRESRPTRRPLRQRLGTLVFWVVIVALLVVGWFVLTAQQVRVTVEPTPERFDLSGSPLHFRLGERHLLRPGEYTVRASREGYAPLEETIIVGRGQPDEFGFVLQELPGLITVRCVNANDPAVPLNDAEVVVNGGAVGRTPLDAIELPRGTHAMHATRDRYQGVFAEIVVEGRGREQAVTLELRPDWADVSIDARPVSAEVLLDGEVVGSTPHQLEVASGTHTIVLRADGYEEWRRELTVVAEQPVSLTDVQLRPARGTVVVETVPVGAAVMIGETYAGPSPVQMQVEPNRDVVVSVSSDGYESARRTVRVEPAGSVTEQFELVAQVGIVRLEIEPSDAVLHVDDALIGPVPTEITLTAVEHRLQISREGYEPVVRAVRPRPDVPARLVVKLEPIAPPDPLANVPRTAGNGYKFVLVEPGAYTMGSSRREQGRQTNETLRSIQLARPFLVGVHEVTNAEFRAFRPEHQSGVVQRESLGGADRPVVQVTWDDAARFCNWMSARDGLPPAYVDVDGVMLAVEPMTTGYRLPTEAEWEYVARMSGASSPLKYAWGDTFPPEVRAGNYADASAGNRVRTIRTAAGCTTSAATSPNGRTISTRSTSTMPTRSRSIPGGRPRVAITSSADRAGVTPRSARCGSPTAPTAPTSKTT
jgi:formylglycine-generating enzyme required for sulfatase activity